MTSWWLQAAAKWRGVRFSSRLVWSLRSSACIWVGGWMSGWVDE